MADSRSVCGTARPRPGGPIAVGADDPTVTGDHTLLAQQATLLVLFARRQAPVPVDDPPPGEPFLGPAPGQDGADASGRARVPGLGGQVAVAHHLARTDRPESGDDTAAESGRPGGT